jgi:hypothetical protein
MVTYEDLLAPKHRIDPLGVEYQPFYCDRVCGNCKLFKPEPWSTRTGICLQFGGVVQRNWVCVLDSDGKLKVTRQQVR